MGIKIRPYEKNSSRPEEYIELSHDYTGSIFNKEVKAYMQKKKIAFEISLFYNSPASGPHFYMELEKCIPREKVAKFIDICKKYSFNFLNGAELIEITTDFATKESIWFIRAYFSNIFSIQSIPLSLVPECYNELTAQIIAICKNENFAYFKKNIYNNLADSTIIISRYENASHTRIKFDKLKTLNILFFLISKLSYKHFESDDFLRNMIGKCAIIKKSFEANIFNFYKRDQIILHNIFLGLYKIGLNKLNLQQNIKIIIEKYCILFKIKYKRDKRWYMTCSTLKCKLAHLPPCNNVVSPFNHMYTEIETQYINTSNKLSLTIKSTPHFVTMFSKNIEGYHKDIIFILIFLGTFLISNKKFSITHNARQYNNLPPILININDENIIPICEAILALLPETTVCQERNLKPGHVLTTIKNNASVFFIDIEGEERFNLIKLFTNYDKNSKKCKKNIKGFGYFSKSENERHFSLGIYENNRLKTYLSNKKGAKQHFSNTYFFDFSENKDKNIYAIDKHFIKSFFDYTAIKIDEEIALNYHFYEETLKLNDIIKNTQVEVLRNKNFTCSLLCSCIIFNVIYQSFINKTNLIINKKIIKDSTYIFKYIEKLLFKSQKSLGDAVINHKKTIIKKLINTTPHYTFLTERELYKFINQVKTNKDATLAINELLHENILIEIAPLARGKRKGPKGRMFLINYGELAFILKEQY